MAVRQFLQTRAVQYQQSAVASRWLALVSCIHVQACAPQATAAALGMTGDYSSYQLNSAHGPHSSLVRHTRTHTRTHTHTTNSTRPPFLSVCLHSTYPHSWFADDDNMPGTGVAAISAAPVPLVVYPENPQFSTAFLQAIPKADLHVHLDGSLRLETLIELAKEHDVKLPADTVEGLRDVVFKASFANLEEYLECFKYTTAVMQHDTALTRIAYELAIDNQRDGVRLLEVRFAPQLHVNSLPGSNCSTIQDVFVAVNRGLQQAKDEFNSRDEVVSGAEPAFDYGIIACALRMFNEYFSSYYCSYCHVHKDEPTDRLYQLASMSLVVAAVKARDELSLPIVALDIAGAERNFEAKTHSPAFQYAHKNFMHRTLHAGEAHGAESIFQALTTCFAERIGHGFHLFSIDKLMSDNPSEFPDEETASKYIEHMAEHIAYNRITIEVCLKSNLDTMPELRNDVGNHVLPTMLSHGLSVALSTDNRTVSNTTLTKEFRTAVDAFKLNSAQVRELAVNAFERAFNRSTYAQHRDYVHQIETYYDKVAADMLQQ